MDYGEGQAAPNYQEAVVTRQQGRSVTKIGQNPNIRPMVHNDEQIARASSKQIASANSISNANNVVFAGQSAHSGAQSKIQPNRGGVALQVGSHGNSRAKHAVQQNSDDNGGGVDQCLRNPRVIVALGLFGIICIVGGFYAFSSPNMNSYVGYVFIFCGFVCWLLVGVGLSKLHSEDDDTPAWLIICCPCVCVLCFICGAAGDGNTVNMFEPRSRRKPYSGAAIATPNAAHGGQQPNSYGKGQIIVSA